MDLLIAEFKNKLIQVTNETNLPITVKGLIFDQVLREINTAANEEIQAQAREREAAIAGKENNNGNE